MAYFTGMYDGAEDPWRFETSFYEDRKRRLLLALLPSPRYERGVEAGCSNGRLTVELARRCERLVAFDPVPECVDRARRRLRREGLDHVDVVTASLPTYWPEGDGDLVVWSEVAYYMGERASAVAMSRLRAWLRPGGTLVAVHWRGPTNYPRSAAAVHDAIERTAWLRRAGTYRDDDMLADVWTCRDAGRSA